MAKTFGVLPMEIMDEEKELATLVRFELNRHIASVGSNEEVRIAKEAALKAKRKGR